MNPQVTEIKLQKSSKRLELSFASGEIFPLSFEYLRVYSPSAEVRGHGMDEPMLVTGKKDILIESIEPVGHYAIRLIFDDGHETGIYSWAFLYDLGVAYQQNWQRYLQRLEAAGATR